MLWTLSCYRGRDHESTSAPMGGRQGGKRPLLTGEGFPDAITPGEPACGSFALPAAKKNGVVRFPSVHILWCSIPRCHCCFSKRRSGTESNACTNESLRVFLGVLSVRKLPFSTFTWNLQELSRGTNRSILGRDIAVYQDAPAFYRVS